MPAAFMEPVPEFVPGVTPPGDDAARPALWFAYRGDKLLVHCVDDQVAVPTADELTSLGLAPERPHYLGSFPDLDCYAVALEVDIELPSHLRLEGLRGLFGRLDDRHFGVAGRASQIAEWDRNHRFCGRCGSPTLPMDGERATQCLGCGISNYPRLSPAVIMLIHDPATDRVLLAHNARFANNFYSTLAGFVEPGETLEETVHREIHEEVGIEVQNLRYFGSQAWPFPHQLMIGFLADYASGEIQVDGVELTDAAWFSRDQIPNLPGQISIARRLVESWLGPSD